jgi:archaellum component FlaC
MSTEQNTLTHIQEIYFDVCDQLDYQSYEEMGYKNKREMLQEFKWKLERIEADFKQLMKETV